MELDKIAGSKQKKVLLYATGNKQTNKQTQS